LEDDNSELNNIRSPRSYFNISARAPIRSYKGLDTMFENDNLFLTKEELSNERKRKFEDSAEEDQKSTKIKMVKYSFKKITYGTYYRPVIVKNNSDNVKTEEKNTKKNVEAAEEIEDTPINVNKRKFCNII